MKLRTLIPATMLAAGFVLAGAMTSSANDRRQPEAQLDLIQLWTDFHGSSAFGDYGLMHSLWADDAVVHAAGQEFVGPDDIADFFSSSPNWGEAAALSPTYKTIYEIHGNIATIQFECVIVNTGGNDPITTSLSTIPFGGQNPDVLIVQHSTATCTAVRQGDGWVFQTFQGSAGPQ